MQMHDISRDYADQIRIYRTYATSSREYFRSRDENDPHTRYAIHRRYRQDLEALGQMRAAERARLAQEREWTVSRRVFTARDLIDGRILTRTPSGETAGPVIDHPDCFVIGRKPVAMVSHTYSTWEKCVEFSQANGLQVERLEFSWYYPGGTLPVLFTRNEPRTMEGKPCIGCREPIDNPHYAECLRCKKRRDLRRRTVEQAV